MASPQTTATDIEPGAVPAPRRPRQPRHSSDSEPQPGWRRSWIVAAPLWLAIHAAYLVLTYVHRMLAGPEEDGSGLLDWVQWDGWRYLEIADRGYEAAPHQAAFFPLYPWLYALLDPVLPGDLVVSALVVSNLAGLGALVVLHRLVALELGDGVAGRTVVYLVAFPSAFFLAAPFNHSLFLLLALGFLFALRHQRWWVAGLIGALASGTRPVGVLLVVPFAYEYLRVHLAGGRHAGSGAAWLGSRLRRLRVDAAAIGLVPLGVAGYAVYCWVALGDPFAYTHAQVGNWDKSVTWPGQTIGVALWELATEPTYALAIDLGATLLAIAAIVLGLVGPWRLRRDQRYLVVFAIVLLVLPLCVPSGAGPVQSLTRYVLDLAVVFAVLAQVGGRGRNAERLFVLPALALQCGFLFLYLDGQWTF